MSALSLAIVALTTGWTVLGATAVARITRMPPPHCSALEPVSVLKPLCGADPSLRENLKSFFEQDHPAIQLDLGFPRAAAPAVGSPSRTGSTAWPAARAYSAVNGNPNGSSIDTSARLPI